MILPMVVLRRLDVLLEPTKEAVFEEMRFQREEAEFTEWDEGRLADASGYVFYNTSKWTLKRLHDTATNSQQILQSNFMEYIDGFSPNVKEIITKFKLRDQIRHMASKDVLLDVLEKFTSPYINLTPFEKVDPDGRKLPPLTNLGMGYVFEELIRGISVWVLRWRVMNFQERLSILCYPIRLMGSPGNRICGISKMAKMLSTQDLSLI